MKLTIVPIDKVVIVDGVAIHDIDMSGIDPDIHAVQFDGASGWIERKDGNNEPVQSVSQFQTIISRHAAALAEIEAKAADPYYGMSPEEKLAYVKQAKVTEINAAFQAAELLPVTIGGHAYRGGFESGLAIDAQRRAMLEYSAVNPLAGITTVDFFDVEGAKVTLPPSSEDQIDALDVCLAVGQAAAINSFKCAQLIAAVRAANSIEAVSTIHW